MSQKAMPYLFAIASGGRAEIETNAPESLVPWWSFTKTILATAVLKLAEQGKVDLDATLPDHPFTMRQLLQHRAGVTDYGHLSTYQQAVATAERPWSREKLLRQADATKPIYPPGEGWRYSNIGYLFVRQFLENALNCSLSHALEELIFADMSLPSVFLAQDTADLNKLAWGNEQNYHPDWVYHGLLVGTPRDAVNLLHTIMVGKVISRPLLTQMLTPHRVGPPLRHWQEPSCGLGLMIDTASEHGLMHGHTGGGPGSGCAVYHFPELPNQPTIGVFASQTHDGDVEGEVLRLARTA